jgi:hypothetical protein
MPDFRRPIAGENLLPGCCSAAGRGRVLVIEPLKPDSHDWISVAPARTESGCIVACLNAWLSHDPVDRPPQLPADGLSDARRRAAGTLARPGHMLHGADVVADTVTGRVRGAEVGGVNVFKGIPYGGSTAGAHRFMPPPAPTPWIGVREALAFGPSAPQRRAGRARPADESEDCLVLNVFTPALGDGRRRPVMVWLHGGGFSSGSGSTWLYDGVNLARRHDVVVVTINHRLNAFGFTHLADMAGAEFASSGAVGMLDIVAALRWVKVHAERFGGDPTS